ncbi:MAG: hypothetical protein ABDH18_05565 [Aquificaceae bacterium]
MKKIAVSIPKEAAVEASIRGGYAISSVPFVAIIANLSVAMT